MAVPGFPAIASTVAPPPTPFIASNLSPPFPTNSFWQNYVLNAGASPELISPYLVQLGSSGVAFGYPRRIATSAMVTQAFMRDLILTVAEGLPSPTIAAYDKLSVTFQWSDVLTVPLVRGSPYLTFILVGATPVFTTMYTLINFTSDSAGSRYKAEFSSGLTWLIYSSEPFNVSVSSLNTSTTISAAAPFTGVIRVALLPANQYSAESILDYYSSVYPTGCDISIGQFQISYNWQSKSFGTLPESELLMLTLPVHRFPLQKNETAFTETVPASSPDLRAASVTYETMDGHAASRVGTSWVVDVNSATLGWYSSNGISNEANLATLQEAVVQDIAQLAPITDVDTYFFGKAIARAARLALIAEEADLPEQAAIVASYLEDNLTPWFSGTFSGNALLYDSRWGGIVSQLGASNSGADFGLGLYNDHHYHYGYFLYAAAVLTKLNADWGQTYILQIYSLVRDILAANPDDPYFPVLRHFDPYVLHSWASGLFEFSAGRNQESTSEAVNAYYAAALVGLAFNDSSLVSLSGTLAQFEVHTAQLLWHVKENSTLYDPVFTSANRVVGVLWSGMRDSSLWFAPAEARRARLGIQVLPITPITQWLFSDIDYVRQFVPWALASTVEATDEWNGFIWALLALYDPSEALANIQSLAQFDGGNSLSNLLWWVYTRTPAV